MDSNSGPNNPGGSLASAFENFRRIVGDEAALDIMKRTMASESKKRDRNTQAAVVPVTKDGQDYWMDLTEPMTSDKAQMFLTWVKAHNPQLPSSYKPDFIMDIHKVLVEPIGNFGDAGDDDWLVHVDVDHRGDYLVRMYNDCLELFLEACYRRYKKEDHIQLKQTVIRALWYIEEHEDFIKSLKTADSVPKTARGDFLAAGCLQHLQLSKDREFNTEIIMEALWWADKHVLNVDQAIKAMFD